jgi:hypothetical protein
MIGQIFCLPLRPVGEVRQWPNKFHGAPKADMLYLPQFSQSGLALSVWSEVFSPTLPQTPTPGRERSGPFFVRRSPNECAAARYV